MHATDATLLANNRLTLLDVKCCVRVHILLPESCCMLLGLLRKVCGQTFSYVQTDAATPNNVASVYTGLKNNKRMITC